MSEQILKFAVASNPIASQAFVAADAVSGNEDPKIQNATAGDVSETDAATQDNMDRKRRAKGRASTVLGSSAGSGSASAKKTLLGF